MIFYFDMDGVLADLEGAVSEYFSVPVRDLYEQPGLTHKLYLKRRAEIGIYGSFSVLQPLRQV